MKKGSIFLAMFMAVFLMASIVMADTWKDYRDARATAITCEEQGNTLCAVDAYLKAREAALELKNFDGTPYQARAVIADWQTNNAAYVLIKAFTKTRDYELLEQAKAILTVNELKGPPAEKAKNNLAYCNEQLKEAAAKADYDSAAADAK